MEHKPAAGQPWFNTRFFVHIGLAFLVVLIVMEFLKAAFLDNTTAKIRAKMAAQQNPPASGG